jgi:predicted Zn-dependent protease
VGEVRDAAENAVSAFNEARSSVSEVAEVRIEDLQSAVNSLERTMGDLPNDASLSEAADAIANEANTVAEAANGVRDQLQCP